MFGGFQFGEGYFGQGAPAIGDVIDLDICQTRALSLMPTRTTASLMLLRQVRALMSERTSLSLMPGRTSRSLMPTRTAVRHCEDD